MATLNEKIADSLQKLQDAGDGNPSVLRTSALSRKHLERLLKYGYLTTVMPGWVVVADPTAQRGDSSPFYANFWHFLALYCEDRFGEAWCIDAQTSLRLHSTDMSVPPQVVVISPTGNNQIQAFEFRTSMFSSRGQLPPIVLRDGLRMMPVSEALVAASPTFFTADKPSALAALGSLRSSAELLVPLLRGGHSVIAGRLAAALRSIGRGRIADDIVSAMEAAGHRTSEADNPLKGVPPGLSFPRGISPAAARVRSLWETMREGVLSVFDQEPAPVDDPDTYLADLDERYEADAYHSLSIEGYKVTAELIAKVRAGWDPEGSKADRDHEDALAAKGYADCYAVVREGVVDILDGARASEVVQDRHMAWFRAMFQPFVTVGLKPPESLAGYRSWFIHLRGSRFVPVAHESLQDAMEAYFDCLDAEADPRVAAVLGHFVFTYIHPFGDGNGRLGRFIMNAVLSSGGYPWTVVPVDDRIEYLRALDAASLDHDIRPFAAFVADLVRREPPPPRRRSTGEEPSYREAGEWLPETDGPPGSPRKPPKTGGTPETQSSDEAAPVGKRPFWRGFVLRAHEILVEGGPLTTEDILRRMPSELIRETDRFQKITPGRLRFKLRERIKERRPFEELPDGRFAAVTTDVPWDGETASSTVVRGR